MINAMPEPTLSELQNSIDELTAYRDRLHKAVASAANKLRMPAKKIEATLKEHQELIMIEEALGRLSKDFEERRNS